MERGCTSGSFVVTATVNGFVSPWSILIDPKHRTTMLVVAPWKGVSRMRRRWKHTIVRLSITVRLATGTCVTVPEIAINLGVNFFDFNSVERCLGIDLDTRYDHILRTGWLTHYEPWIDWSYVTLAETRSRIRGNSKSHEPSSARKQKHYRREPLPVLASVLQMCLLSLLDTTHFNEKVPS